MTTLASDAGAVGEAIRVRPLQPAIGAEIEGVDLGRPLTRAIRDQIWDALSRHGAIFFRDQDITRAQHIAFGEAFGQLQAHPIAPNPEDPRVLIVAADGVKKQGADIWHSDHSDQATSPVGSILRACIVPSLGGDTVFSSAVAAYNKLDNELKARIEGLRAVHDQSLGYAKRGLDATQQKALLEKFPPVEHPVVRIHPETGQRMLYVNEAYTSHIVGLSEAESRALLRTLVDEFKKPEHQVRFQWRVHSIAFWDNRAVQHYAVTDYTEPRRLERITIDGEAPFGPGDERIEHILPTLA